MSTITTFANGLPPASFTRPVIVTVARGGLSIFSTGEASSEGVEAGAEGDSGVGVADNSGVAAAADGVSGVGLGVGSGVASGAGVGDVGAGDVKSGDCCGEDDGSKDSGGVVCGVTADGSGEGVAEGVGEASTPGVSGSTGVADGALSVDEVG